MNDCIFKIAVYFEPTDIRIWMFLSIIPDRNELKAAVRSLHDRAFVVFSENTDSFVVSEPARAHRLSLLKRRGTDELYLKGTILFLRNAKPSYYSHFASVFQHAKKYPNLLKDLGNLPARMLQGMIHAKRFTAAVDFGKEWIDSLKAVVDDNHWTVLHLRLRLGLALLERGESRQAMSLVMDVYQKTRKAGFGTAKVLDVMTVLIEVFIKADPKSEDNLRQLVFNGRKVSECKHLTGWWVNYADVISGFGLAKEGISIVQEVIKCRRRVFGPRNDKINSAMIVKAKMLTSVGRFSDSLKVLRKVETIRRNKFGIMHPKTLLTKLHRGKVLLKQAKLEEALKLFEQAAERSRIAFGERHRLFFIAGTEIIRTYVLQKNFAEALEHCSGLHEKLIAFFGRVHRECFFFRKQMGDILWELNKRHQALVIFKELLENFENCYKFEADLQALRRRAEGIESSLFKAGWGTLHLCAKRGDWRAITNLIDSGWNVESKDPTGLTPFHYASAFGQVKVARLLLQKGASYAPVSKDGYTSHDVAGEPEIIKLLDTAHDFFKAVEEHDVRLCGETVFKEPCLLGAKDHKGETPLFLAAARGDVEMVEYFLDHGADQNVAGGTYDILSCRTGTPLMAAAYNGHIEVVKALVMRGGDVLLKDRLNRDILHVASERRYPHVVKYLLAHGAVYCANAGRQMPRQTAIDPSVKSLFRLIEGLFHDTKKGNVKRVVTWLREMEDGEVAAVSGARDDKLRTLVQVANRQGNKELVRMLVKRFNTK